MNAITPRWHAKLQFAVIGCCGFGVDWLLFNALLHLGWPPLSCRVVAFVAAALTTFIGNRLLTFAADAERWQQQAGRYAITVLCSCLPNLTVFTLLATLGGDHWLALQLALILGVLAGMVSNWWLSSRWVFVKR
ncbi:GtrA family protein [Ferrimonas senticii]|uniref:GtrA family protein n=1 Tax=Ferrimonas senticii TaxID=394566 RepID=UPI0004208463|nr:GtrA family protein [Ferrimonas senticii]